MSALRGFYHERWDWAKLQRPRLIIAWSGPVEWYIALDFSDGNTDPVWLLEWDCSFTPTEAAGWRGRVIDWLQSRCAR